MRVIAFATTGLAGSELDTVVKLLRGVSRNADGTTSNIASLSFVYEPSMTNRTSLLIACTSTSAKFSEARRRSIPIVTPKWVLETGGDLSKCVKYSASSLIGQLISTAALDPCSRDEVKAACAVLGAVYQASLCRRCTLLIIPQGGVPSGNEKVTFAHKHDIRLIPMDDFRIEFASGAMRELAPTSVRQQQPQPTAAESAGCHVPNQAPAAVEMPILESSLAGVCCYCMPSPVPPSVVRLLVEAKCHRVPTITPNTTHAVIWKEGACETMPSLAMAHPSLETVSIKWIEACLQARKRLPEALFRVTLPAAPVITFSSIPMQDKNRLIALTTSSVLTGKVQDSLVLGSVEQLRRDPRQNELLLTTHLVLPELHLRYLDGYLNRKVQVIVSRFIETKRVECRIVSVEWIYKSAEAGKWIDATPFEVSIRSVVNLNLTAALERQKASAERQQQDQSRSCDRPKGTTSVPHVIDEKKHGADPIIGGTDAGSTSESSQQQNQHVVLSLEEFVTRLEAKATVCAAHKHQTSSKSPLLGDAGCAANAPSFHPDKTSANSAANLCGAVCGGSPFTSRTAILGGSMSHIQQQQQAGRVAVQSSYADESQVVFYRHTQEVPSQATSPQQQLLAPPPLPQLHAQQQQGEGGPRCFLLAKSYREEAAASRVVESLGGSMVTSIEECSHYIVPKPSKTETFLRCVAAGKWILAPTYLSRCDGERRFVDEVLEEWGSTPQLSFAPLLRPSGENTASIGAPFPPPSAVSGLAAACPLQRKKGGGAFASWRVVLSCTDEPRGESFSRVLASGGCKSILSVTPNQLTQVDRSCLTGATHILCDDGCINEDLLSRFFRDELGITVYRMELLVHVLCSSAPTPELFSALEWVLSRKRPRLDEA